MDIESIKSVLSTIYHPALDDDIVSLGLVEDIKIVDNTIKFRLIFPSHNPFEDSIKKDCESALKDAFPNMKVSILLLIKEQKATKKTIQDLGPEELSKVKKVIAIASGKGGVGKSTVAVNLAVALARLGYKVGLADADVYGPSIPKMTGTEGMMPEVEEGGAGYDENGMDLIIPLEKYGVKWMSIGYFASPEQALIWRGPMACNALKQIIFQVKWGELDFLLIDLPPGTGDIHISLVHDTPLAGAVIVSTPQDVALADVLKGVNMFRNKDVNVPILGLVENMAWFTPAELPNNKYYIFGKNGGVEMAKRLEIPLLAQVPIYMSIREGGDNGIPASNSDTPDGIAFRQLAEKIIAYSL
jgi:ATP-binding protein involved in chromosome partitioning